MAQPYDNKDPPMSWLQGGGELGRMIRAHDWASTSLGPLAGWSRELLSILNTVINSAAPMLLFWGDERLCFYNDAYRPVLGTQKHPGALGRPGAEVWHEIWSEISPLIDGVMARGEAAWQEDMLLAFNRHGYLEEIYFTFGYSPVYVDARVVGGTLATLSESSAEVLLSRRLETLRQLAATQPITSDRNKLAADLADTLGQNRHDVPFFVLYEVTPAGIARRLCAVGMDEDPTSSPLTLSLTSDHAQPWPLAQAMRTNTAQRVDDLGEKFGALSGGAWPEAPDTAVVLPIVAGSGATPTAFAIVGINPRKRLDAAYWQFLELLGSQLGATLTAARAIEGERVRAEMLNRSEIELRTMLDNLLAMVAILSADGTVLEANKVPLEIAGITRDDVVGKPFWECYWWQHLDDAQAGLRDAITRAAGGETLQYDVAVHGRGDELMMIDFKLAPSFDTHGTVTRLVASGFDITDRTIALRDLASARNAADAANRAKSEFLANLSHEIRSPLSAILGYTELLDAALETPKDRQYVETIHESGLHLLDLVNDILDLSRIEGGALRVTRESVDLRALLGRLHVSFAPAIADKDLTLSIRNLTPIPATVTTDGQRLRQILTNLLGNAVKFTDAGRVGIDVALREADTPASLEFVVHDTGPGIPAAQRAGLFDAFSQIDTTDARAHEGAGLGLAISKRLATMLDGSLELDTNSKRGSRFVLRIPARFAGADDMISAGTEHAEASPRERASATPRKLDGRVLAIDDRRDMCLLVREYLERAGAVVATAGSAEEGLARVTQAEAAGQAFDVIVMDMQMPGLDGFAATRRLRSEGYTRPVIALTASAMKTDQARSLAAGCSAFLTKPIDRELLVETVGEAIAAARSSPLLPRGDAEPGTRTRVLLVDDDRSALTALEKLLTLKGFAVEVACDGAAALAAAARSAPAVAVIDIRLPDMSGFELAGHLRALPGGVAIRCAALSGFELDRDELANSVFEQRFLKPVDLAELVAFLQ